MDQDVQQIYDLLVEENYPVTLPDLKNPTSEYMVKIVLTFLSGFSIDGNTVQKATFGQLESLSYPEAHQEVISLINLHEVMLKISNRIFVKDFYLTDMTSPGAKKIRRLIFTLLNFVLYVNNKMKDLIEPLDAIFNRLNTQNDLIQKKHEAMEARKTVVLENSKKTALKEKYIKQIEETKRRIEQKNKKIVVLEQRAQSAKLAKQQAQQRNGLIKRQVAKLNEKIVEMEEMVVKSPEKFKARVDNFGQDCNDKQEKLVGLIDRLHAKQDLKSQFDKVEDFVNQECEKFSKVQDAHLKSKTLSKTKAEISKQLVEVQDSVQSLQDELANLDGNSQCDTANIDEVQAQCHSHIAPLRQLHMKFLSKIQEVKKRLEEAELRYQQSCYEKNDLNKKIISLNEEIAEFLKDCQDLYTGDLLKQAEIEKIWKEKYNIE